MPTFATALFLTTCLHTTCLALDNGLARLPVLGYNTWNVSAADTNSLAFIFICTDLHGSLYYHEYSSEPAVRELNMHC